MSIGDPSNIHWAVPYIDQPLSFWEKLWEDFGSYIKEVYFPLPGNLISSGRPLQPSRYLKDFLHHTPFAHSVLINPIILPRPVEDFAPTIVDALQRLSDKYGLASVTISNLTLASRILESMPELSLTASVLMDISQPNQVIMLNGIFDNLVPASRIMRNLPALRVLRSAFAGRIRLIVNEACLPGCPFRIQHFHEMGSSLEYPHSLCREILSKHPWMRLTGAWVLPQHLHFYDGIYDELKIAGRVTLRDPADYLRVLGAYIHRRPLPPNAIGGGPASVKDALPISEEFYSCTLKCGHQCHQCAICREYHEQEKKNLSTPSSNAGRKLKKISPNCVVTMQEGDRKTSMKKLHPILPIFHIKCENVNVLYTPGQVAVVELPEVNLIQKAWENGKRPEDSSVAQRVASWLKENAQKTIDNRRLWLNTPYAPECLTIHLSNSCNLSCPYCYSDSDNYRQKKAGHSILTSEEKAVRAAAHLVAKNCAEKGKPFHLVLHGGGEPTLHWELVTIYEILTREIANRFGVKWFGYIATNGVLSERKARWLATHFDLVGLSCDGPPNIQDQQRPLEDGGKSSPFVERTARVIAEAGGKFDVRSTITPQTFMRQVEIVSYLKERLGAWRIRFEPAFRLGEKNLAEFRPDQANSFVEHFLAAQEKARYFGASLSFTGVRLDEVHGPYCDILRDVLRLYPDGTAKACFCCPDYHRSGRKRFDVGYLDAASDEFLLDTQRIAWLRHAGSHIPKQCHNCVNVHHCARECPDLCCIDGYYECGSASGKTEMGSDSSFRCLVQQKIALAWIIETAKRAEKPKTDQAISPMHNRDTELGLLMAYLDGAPSVVDTDAIVSQWKAIRTKYRIEDRRMPSPIWAERGFEHDGAKAWQILSRDIARKTDGSSVSIYIHVPFCDHRCGFCDCYSIPIRKLKEPKEKEYARVLLAEMEEWSLIRSLNDRPITTIHFGGGTPTYLSPVVFENIIHHCHKCFNLTQKTELAIESTSSLLSSEHLMRLRKWGFSRLHVGVQTLDNHLRKLIGRREKANVVLERLTGAIEKGFVTSVDIIYGLPGQTVSGLVDTLSHLVNVGVHGVSLYRLNISKRNRQFLKKCADFEQNAFYDYVLFQTGDQFLTHAGYQKNHFAHYALSEDRNIYYTCGQRGEGLLALGPTADGVFEDYHYRHPGYREYINGVQSGFPSLEGGLRETLLEQKLRPAKTALMVGGINIGMLRDLEAESLGSKWVECRLISKCLGLEVYSLTANGSWFVDDMIAELKRRICTRVFPANI